MGLADVILLVLLGGFIMFGAWFGLFHTLGSLVGAIVGTVVAGWLHIPIADFLVTIFGNSPWVHTITFAVIFIFIARLIGFGFYLLDETFSLVTRLPFLSSIDRIVGAVIGFFEGVLVIGMLLFVASRYNLGQTMTDALRDSSIAEWFVNSSAILQPLFPKAFQELRSIIGI